MKSGKRPDKDFFSQGFSLLEVIIAITIFAIFLSAYVVSQGQNLSDSARLREDLIFRKLAGEAIDQIILDPPTFSPSLTLAPETKKFEDEYEDYEYTVEYKKIELPNLGLMNPEDAAGIGGQVDMRKKVYKEVKENVENMLWQVAVTVKKISEDDTYTVSTWIRNRKGKIEISP
ncbi:MAG: prepilin-type N-terminal cleavage/methylation domain-containing protein [Bacteriovoracales bacterium]|nr:prepilin-type N-terminal cleavage/methylation domain-containing protein [Bacteriovoracales bacterium]